MKTLMNTCPIVIAENHIEIAGHELHEAPSINELAELLGHDYRTIVDKSDHRFRNWVWDRVGIHCLPLATLEHDPKEKVRYIFIILNALGYDAGTGYQAGPRESFPGPITVFGHRQAPNQTANAFVRQLIASAVHVDFAPEIPHVAARQRSRRLKGGGMVTLIDASLQPGVDTTKQEVAICYEFPLSRVTDSPLVSHKLSKENTNVPTTALPPARSDGPWEVFTKETLRMLTRWFWRGGWKLLFFLTLLALLYFRHMLR